MRRKERCYVYDEERRDSGRNQRKYDKDKFLIYEGDIVEIDFRELGVNEKSITLVTYSSDTASFILLDFDSHKYYSIGRDKCNFIKVIGNVFENPDLLPKEAFEEGDLLDK